PRDRHRRRARASPGRRIGSSPPCSQPRAYCGRRRERWRHQRPALRWSAMTETTPGVPLGAWLAELDDERLIRLLELRPDLTQPPPGSIAALAARAQARQSVKAATDGLDFLRLAVLDATVRVAAEAAGGLPWYPGQATLEDSGQTDIAARLEALDAPQRDLLQRLLEGSPMGRTRDAAPGTPPDRPVQRLLAAGLLRQMDNDTVILPRLVGQV